MTATSPPTGPRGDRTREALIRAAIDAFGRHGFGAASTRAIAVAAGVNQALIGYHFGGKPGLYAAALEHIAAAVQERMKPIVTALETELGLEPVFPGEAADRCVPPTGAATADAAERENLLAGLHRLLDAFVVMITSDESAPWARMVLREQQDPTQAFDILYGGIMSPLFRVTATLVAGVVGTGPRDPETRLLVTTVLAQALIFRMARATIVRQMDWTSIGTAERAAIQSRIRRNVAAILAQEIRA